MTKAEVAPGPPSRAAFPLLVWAHFLNDGSVNYVPAILPVLMAAHHFPLALAGTMVLALQGVTSIFQPLVGVWADRRGGKAFVWTGVGLAALGGSSIGFAPSFSVLLGLLVLTGIGNTLFHPQALATASTTTRTRGVRLSVFLVGGELGRGLWPLLMSVIVMGLGLRGLGLIILPTIVTLPFLARALPGLPPSHRDAAPLHLSGNLRKMASIVAFQGLRAAATFGLLTFVPLLWHSRGGSLVGGASLLSALLVVGIAGNLAGGWIADRIGRTAPLVVSSLVGAVCLGLFLHATGIWNWVTMGLTGIALFSSNPVAMLISQDAFPGNRSMASGLALGSGNAVGAFVAFGLGPVAARFGLGPTLWILVVALVLSAPMALLLPRRPDIPA